jgi:hypothetical protein
MRTTVTPSYVRRGEHRPIWRGELSRIWKRQARITSWNLRSERCAALLKVFWKLWAPQKFWSEYDASQRGGEKRLAISTKGAGLFTSCSRGSDWGRYPRLPREGQRFDSYRCFMMPCAPTRHNDAKRAYFVACGASGDGVESSVNAQVARRSAAWVEVGTPTMHLQRGCVRDASRQVVDSARWTHPDASFHLQYQIRTEKRKPLYRYRL